MAKGFCSLTGLGRFIQPDPYIQSPADLQNFNRYSYVLNNPLKYTDPTGYKIGYQSPYVGKGTSYIGSDGYSMFDQGRIDNNLTEFDRETAQAGLDAGRYSSGGPAAGGGGGVGIGAKGGGKKGTGTGQNARSNDKLGSAATMPSFDSPVVEIIAQKVPKRPDQINTDALGDGFNAFGFANGAKTEIMDYAVRAGSSQAGMRAELQTLGKAGTRYLNAAKGLSKGVGILGVAFTGVDAYQKGQWQNHHTADVLVGLGATFMLSGPWGWAAGGAYFLIDLGVKSYSGKSITENLFDKP